MHRLRIISNRLPRFGRPTIVRRRLKCCSQLALIYTSCSGSTRIASELIHEQLIRAAHCCSAPIDLQQVSDASQLQHYSGYIVGAPTYNTNANCQRTGTAWDDMLYNGALHQLQLQGKPFAVFGCGDAVRFKNNFADAIGEIHDVLLSAGGVPLSESYTRPSTYLMAHSKSIRAGRHGADSCFVGLPLDFVNQPELSEARITSWCIQIQQQLQEQFPGALQQSAVGLSRTPQHYADGLHQHQQQQQQHQRQQQQKQGQQLEIGDWAAEWPRQGLFNGEYPRRFRFTDRWYQLGDRWYRFADEGFAVRAGFREHAVYTYAYRDIQNVEVKQPLDQWQQQQQQHSAEDRPVEVWVTLQQEHRQSFKAAGYFGAVASADGGAAAGAGVIAANACQIVVLKEVDCWSHDGSNTIASFLQLQKQLHSRRSGRSQPAVV